MPKLFGAPLVEGGAGAAAGEEEEPAAGVRLCVDWLLANCVPAPRSLFESLPDDITAPAALQSAAVGGGADVALYAQARWVCKMMERISRKKAADTELLPSSGEGLSCYAVGWALLVYLRSLPHALLPVERQSFYRSLMAVYEIENPNSRCMQFRACVWHFSLLCSRRRAVAMEIARFLHHSGLSPRSIYKSFGKAFFGDSVSEELRDKAMERRILGLFIGQHPYMTRSVDEPQLSSEVDTSAEDTCVLKCAVTSDCVVKTGRHLHKKHILSKGEIVVLVDLSPMPDAFLAESNGALMEVPFNACLPADEDDEIEHIHTTTAKEVGEEPPGTEENQKRRSSQHLDKQTLGKQQQPAEDQRQDGAADAEIKESPEDAECVKNKLEEPKQQRIEERRRQKEQEEEWRQELQEQAPEPEREDDYEELPLPALPCDIAPPQLPPDSDEDAEQMPLPPEDIPPPLVGEPELPPELCPPVFTSPIPPPVFNSPPPPAYTSPVPPPAYTSPPPAYTSPVPPPAVEIKCLSPSLPLPPPNDAAPSLTADLTPPLLPPPLPPYDSPVMSPPPPLPPYDSPVMSPLSPTLPPPTLPPPPPPPTPPPPPPTLPPPPQSPLPPPTVLPPSLKDLPPAVPPLAVPPPTMPPPQQAPSPPSLQRRGSFSAAPLGKLTPVGTVLRTALPQLLPLPTMSPPPQASFAHLRRNTSPYIAPLGAFHVYSPFATPPPFLSPPQPPTLPIGPPPPLPVPLSPVTLPPTFVPSPPTGELPPTAPFESAVSTGGIAVTRSSLSSSSTASLVPPPMPPPPVDTSGWAAQVPPEMVSQLPDMLNKRAKVAAEILSTETSYVSHLSLIVHNVVEPLKVATRGLSQDEVFHLFANLEFIRTHHTKFKVALTACLASWTSDSVMGQVFLDNIRFIKLYPYYVNNHNTALATLQSCKSKYPMFNKFIQTVDYTPALAGFNLEGLFIVPVQRIPRYVLLLSDMLKSTPLVHPDFQPLTDALSMVRSLADYINQRKHEADNSAELQAIQNQWSHFSGNLVTGHRHFVKEGVTMLERSAGTKKRQRVWLFSDVLMLTDAEAKKGKYKYRQVLDLKTASVQDDGECAWKILCSEGVFVFKVEKTAPQEKTEWLMQLGNVLEEQRRLLLRSAFVGDSEVQSNAEEGSARYLQLLAEEHERKREEAMRALVTSEQDYVTLLQYTFTKFLEPLKNSSGSDGAGSAAGDGGPLLKYGQAVAICSNFAQLLTEHEAFLDELEARLAAWAEKHTVTDLFLDRSQFLKLYTLYVQPKSQMQRRCLFVLPTGPVSDVHQ
eukprot:TRINITY_DN536_c0_g1_i11.p1 TRINITY_DN536_c0_g1~~TRINITY_DN536_c0_g1_i11.p1  ORF type:complete len:1299 (+),score=392.00 TRINITY_DN536_c0_g1_i11:58-3954(+)